MFYNHRLALFFSQPCTLHTHTFSKSLFVPFVQPQQKRGLFHSSLKGYWKKGESPAVKGHKTRNVQIISSWHISLVSVNDISSSAEPVVVANVREILPQHSPSAAFLRWLWPWRCPPTSGRAISGWPFQVGHFRLGHFRFGTISGFGHFRLAVANLGWAISGWAISGWTISG